MLNDLFRLVVLLLSAVRVVTRDDVALPSTVSEVIEMIFRFQWVNSTLVL